MKPRVLVADDDQEIRYVLTKTLEKDFDLHLAEDGPGAITALRGIEPEVVITDLHMPGATGFDIVAAAQELDETLPVIIITGSGNLGTAIAALRRGAYDYLVKPFEDLGAVHHAINRALDTRALRQRNLRLLHDLREKNSILQRQADRLSYELQLAQHIQKSVVPDGVAMEGVKVFARLLAARHVGGDFYDYRQSVTEANLKSFVIGDVVGKGVPAALLMMLAMSTLRELGRFTRSPRRLLSLCNDRVREHLREAEKLQISHTMSVAALVLDTQSLEMRYAKAGHEDFLLLCTREKKVRALTSSGLFIGAFEDGMYGEEMVQLHGGDRIFMHTDGIPDTRSGDGDSFGMERFISLIEEHQALPLEPLGEKLLEEIERFRGGAEPTDDVALMILEVE